MSKLLREYDAIITQLLTTAQEDELYIVARLQKRDYYRTTWRNHKLDDAAVSQNTGLGLYVFTKLGHVAFGSTNSLSESDVLGLYASLADAARTNEKLGIAHAPEIYQLDPQENLGEDALHYQRKDLLDYDLSELPRMLESLDKRVQATHAEASFVGSMDVEQDQWRIVRSDGTDVDFSIPKVRVRQAAVTLRIDEASTQVYFRLAGSNVDELKAIVAESDEEFSDRINEGLQQLRADAIEAGSPAVLMDAELIGMIAHEALGHPAESDIIAGGGSVLGNEDNSYKTGLQVADSGINVTDHEENLNHGFHPYGAFGNARQRVSIVKDGKLHESISDIFSAERIGVPNKNCERSESYGAPAIPRMSNTYVHIDEHKDMIADHGISRAEVAQRTLKENGMFDKYPTILYLQGMRGGSVNPSGGTFMFGTQFVYEITKDSVVPKKPVSFSGDALSALKSIRFAAGKIDTTDFGYCGKASQTAYVNAGGNALVFLEPNEKIKVA
jgi:TldD protein